MAVGYLLARASDTIADTTVRSADERRAQLQTFVRLVEPGSAAGSTAAAQAPQAQALADSFAAAQENEDERRLIMAMPQALQWLEALPSADADDVRKVLHRITHGQMLDVERFASATAASPHQLSSATELHEYTYLVAGCVGEFWTRVAQRHDPHFASLPLQQMMALGRSYGQALQLVNILRDTEADRAGGRCYLPAESPLVAPWLTMAQAGLDDGMRYALALRGRRLRVASALPAMLGTRTLALLEAAGTSGHGLRVKVPRGQVRALLWRTALSLGSARSLQWQYAGLRRETAAGEWDNRPQ